MSKATYFQRGESLDYKNETDSAIEVNDLIDLGHRLAVAGDTIQPGSTGAVHVTGVFGIKKTGTDAIQFGQIVYFDGDGITDDADNGQSGEGKIAYTIAGFAACKATASDDTILVKIG